MRLFKMVKGQNSGAQSWNICGYSMLQVLVVLFWLICNLG
jgi:hypothetical protein